MDPMSDYLAKATISAGLANAQERQPGRRIEADRRAERRRRRRLAIARWRGRRALPRPEVGARKSVVAAATHLRSPSVELALVLEKAAHRVAEEGTFAERRLLEAMSQVASQSAPGASAALVDPDGSEVSRLRAFGLVHAHVQEALGPREHAWLLELLVTGDGFERPGRVA